MWQGLRRNLTMTVATILTITIALFFLGSALLFHAQINRTHDYWFGKIQVSVFLKDGLTQSEFDAIDNELHTLPQVAQVYHETKAQAYARFKKEFAAQPALVENTSESQLPESFRVKLKDPKQFRIVKQAVQNMPGVDQVADEAPVLKKIFSFFSMLGFGVLVAAAVAVIAALLLIFNNVRLAAFSRRREVGIMRLVGASDFYIQAPFILENVVGTVVGVVIAGAALALVKLVLFDHGIAHTFNTALLDIIGWSTVVATIPLLLVAGLFMSVLMSALTLQRYLRV
jgi:cell division transport system permease protein